MDIIKFDKKVKCGPEFVALRIIENCNDLKVGSIWLPDMTDINGRLAFCRIEDVGEKSAEEYGIQAGDYVMIDRLSTFAHTAPVCVCKYNNVICFTNETNTEFKPLKNMIFVEPDNKTEISNIGGIYVSNYEDKLNTGIITDMNCEQELKLPFNIGDRVILTKGADMVSIGSKTLYIYKPDMLVCKIEE